MGTEASTPLPSAIWDEYAVRCPKCGGEAVASMVLVGTTGTYQEAFAKLGTARITCGGCGLARDTSPGKEGQYEFWYATEFDGHRLWARNLRHLNFLIEWLSGEIKKRPDNIATRAYLNALPRWLRSGRNRPELLARLRKLRGDFRA